MKAIAAADKNWAIGYKGGLLARIPEDMKMFRNETVRKVVIYGRKTLESLPEGKPLKDRKNIVLSRNDQLQAEGAIIAHSREEMLGYLSLPEFENYSSDDIYIIGGESIFRGMIDLCDTALITRIEDVFQADVWFPDLDKDDQWEKVQEGEMREYEGLHYHFDVYRRKG